VPRLSHQLPVEVVVAGVVTAVVEVVVDEIVVVDVGAIDVVVAVVVDVVVLVLVLVVVAELQDASTIVATMRKLSAIQITPFFIYPPLFI
jgi:hypothetical protein